MKRCLAALTCGVLLALGISWGALAPASAATDETNAALSEAQEAIESSSQAYDEAMARTEELKAQIDSSEQRLAELREIIPAQQEKSADAIRELYKLERDSSSWIEMFLASETFSDLLSCFDYLDQIQTHHLNTLNDFIASKNELDETRASLSQARQDAEEEAARAQEALEAAQQARAEAQAQAEREAEAERAAAAQAVAATGQEAPATSGDGSYATVTEDGSVGSVTPPTQDNADWGSDKSSFVSSWGARINAYLAGSPLAGYGEVFASAAWDYGVDPRWSPAISCVESGKGAACFRPHNAWGWGNSGWGSWEQAINSHVAGLARGYGYTISEAAAQQYCPPNWSSWYNNVSAQMSMI